MNFAATPLDRQLHNGLRRRAVRVTAIAAAVAATMAAMSSQAAVTPEGTVQARNGGTIGFAAGDLLLLGDELWIGLNQAGGLSVNGGSTLQVGQLSLAQNGGRSIPAEGVSWLDLSGFGSTVRFQSLGIGEWGSAMVHVSAGALFDGRAGGDGCPRAFCNMLLGNTAGSTAQLVVSGANSEANFRPGFTMAAATVHTPATSGFYLGTPGGATSASVQVLDGGWLRTFGGNIGAGPGLGANGQERTFASVVLDGSGSRWSVENAGGATTLGLATHRIATATLDVRNGARIDFQGGNGVYNTFNVSPSGGRATLNVSGAGSGIDFRGDASTLLIGNGNGGVGSASFSDRADVQGLWYIGVGRNGSTGSLLADGVGTLLRLNGSASAAANGVSGAAALEIGRNGGNGQMVISNGARVVLSGSDVTTNRLGVSVGRDATSTGRLTISGAGSQLLLQAGSAVAGGGAGESFNPIMNLGRDGSGTLDINNRGELRLEGGATSIAGAARDTTLNIGGQSDTATAGRATANVSGIGSLLSVTGSDASIRVGRGPGAMGMLTVSAGAIVESTLLSIGRAGQGQLLVDQGQIRLSEQFSSNDLVATNLSVGSLGGNGIATIRGGSSVSIVNAGVGGAGVFIGGTGLAPLGSGVLNVSNSSIDISAGPNMARFVVGYDGNGLATLDHSNLTLANGRLIIASQAGSSGVLRLSNGSEVTTGWAGVGYTRAADGSTANGGVGTLIVNDSTLNTGTLEIGSAGYLGGNGHIAGNVINHGVVNPGNSPGTLLIDGSFVNAAGGRIVLEVESNGAGGFVTDHLIFQQGSNVNLSGASITFRFLGNTDPNAFKASGGFDVDQFIVQRGASGDLALADAAYGGVSFAAESSAYQFSNFSYSAAAGAAFNAVPVPEPQTKALLLGGVLALGWLLRRRSAQGQAAPANAVG